MQETGKMKKLFSLMMFLICFVFLADSYAETMYVIDRLEVVVRANKGVEHAIVAVVRSDDRVAVLRTEGEYAFIRCPRGVEGWMLKRYLTATLPKSQELEKLKNRVQSATEEISTLTQDRQVLKNNLRLREEELKQTENELEDLKEASSEFIALRQQYDQLKQEMEDTALKADKLFRENRELRGRTNFLWFVAGASAILFGFITGMLLQSLRYYKRRKSRF